MWSAFGAVNYTWRAVDDDLLYVGEEDTIELTCCMMERRREDTTELAGVQPQNRIILTFSPPRPAPIVTHRCEGTWEVNPEPHWCPVKFFFNRNSRNRILYRVPDKKQIFLHKYGKDGKHFKN